MEQNETKGYMVISIGQIIDLLRCLEIERPGEHDESVTISVNVRIVEGYDVEGAKQVLFAEPIVKA